MPYLLRFTVLLLACVIAGCAHLGGAPTTAKVERAHPMESAPNQQRLMLNEGYSLLYQDAGALDLGELILYVKVETEAVDDIVTAAGQLGAELKKQLEQIARDYPAVRIDLDPLPEMEKRKRTALSKDRAHYFAPVVGHGGREYERTVLIGYVNGANHERHLCQVMAEAEPNPNLKKFLLDAEKRYDSLYEHTNTLLEKEYFKNPNGKSKE
jgi:hypothetical protein